ncbi:hypothetical protein DSL72_005441 [Monilinia vaccinii-corymbosi]|uniref:Uncharacterized protein n=1 Tax=Monilinia vaccinii-corymbosi TaxID=61207 RepID=A0A8A3PFD1_9HELO|nr:hypothetical protein DSL72_005441 [Monilinia vaccinii-corymbosi]
MAKHSKDQRKTSKSRKQTKKMSKRTRTTSHGSSTDSSSIGDFQHDNLQYAVVSQGGSSAAGSNTLSHGTQDQRAHNAEMILHPEARPISQERLVPETRDFHAESMMVEAEDIEVENQSILPKWGSVDENDRADVRWQSFESIVDRPLSANDFYTPPITFREMGSQFAESTYPNLNFATYDQSTYSYPATITYDQLTTTLENAPVTTQFYLREWTYESWDSVMGVNERMGRYHHDL